MVQHPFSASFLIFSFSAQFCIHLQGWGSPSGTLCRATRELPAVYRTSHSVSLECLIFVHLDISIYSPFPVVLKTALRGMGPFHKSHHYWFYLSPAPTPKLWVDLSFSLPFPRATGELCLSFEKFMLCLGPSLKFVRGSHLKTISLIIFRKRRTIFHIKRPIHHSSLWWYPLKLLNGTFNEMPCMWLEMVSKCPKGGRLLPPSAWGSLV